MHNSSTYLEGSFQPGSEQCIIQGSPLAAACLLSLSVSCSTYVSTYKAQYCFYSVILNSPASISVIFTRSLLSAKRTGARECIKITDEYMLQSGEHRTRGKLARAVNVDAHVCACSARAWNT